MTKEQSRTTAVVYDNARAFYGTAVVSGNARVFNTAVVGTGFITLKTGDLAYYDDSSADCIPCKVLSITGKSGFASNSQRVSFKLTAKRGAYKKGEVLERNALYVLPRKALRGSRILAYKVQADCS